MTLSKKEARQLAIDATKAGAQVLRGVLAIGPDGLKVDGVDVSEWLARHVDAELMLIAAPIDKPVVEIEIKSCYTCGQDYQGDVCPRCAEVRARLRG